MARVILKLGERERSALKALAKREKRIPRAQAAFIIHQELERRGLLPALGTFSNRQELPPNPGGTNE